MNPKKVKNLVTPLETGIRAGEDLPAISA